MPNKKSFVFKNLIKKPMILLFLLLVIWLIFTVWTSSAVESISSGSGLGLSFLNTVLGYAMISWGYYRGEKEFYLSVYGGMIFRILLIFILLFILINAFQLNIMILFISLIISYFSFLILEIYQLHKLSG